MITVNTKALEKALQGTKRSLDNEMKIAINRTVRATATDMNKRVREDVALKARDVRKTISTRKSPGGKEQNGQVRLAHEKRLPLKYFNANHIRRGVSYRISKGEGRKLVRGGFMGPRAGAMAVKLRGHAFKRKGKKRLPIQKLMGVSPWGVFDQNNMKPEQQEFARKRLAYELGRRVEFNTLKKKGLI